MSNIAGKGWLLIEQDIHSGNESLISIIDARSHARYVKQYMEQRYVDKYASIDEKILYKKNKSNWPYRVNQSITNYSGILDCGDSNMFVAYRCHKLQLNDNLLVYTYRIYKGGAETGNPVFEEKTKSIIV